MNAPGSRSFLVATLLSQCLLAGGCAVPGASPNQRDGANAPASPGAGAQTVPSTGVWTVTGHTIPGTSAMTHAQADRWRGQSLRLLADRATGIGSRCDDPVYRVHVATIAELLGGGYGLTPRGITSLTPHDRVDVVDITCEGSAWVAPGGRLILLDRTHALMPWDGVFFRLVRDADFRAQGQEPGWHLDILKGESIRLSYSYGERQAVTPVPPPEANEHAGHTVYHAVTEANDLRVVIVPTECHDIMSGQPFEATVTVTLNGQTWTGCGGTVADDD